MIRFSDGILEPSTLPSHTENQWLALPGCEGFGATYWSRLFWLSACQQGLGWQLGSEL